MKERFSKLKQIFLEYVIGYRNPQNYWNKRWQIYADSTSTLTNPYNRIHELMLQNECANILEVGCGLASLRNLPNYLGLDFSLEALRKSKLESYLVTDLRTFIPIPSKSFDAILSRYVLLHIPIEHIETAVSELSRIAKKLLILEEPWYKERIQLKPHCFAHNLPELFKKYFDGKTVYITEKSE